MLEQEEVPPPPRSFGQLASFRLDLFFIGNPSRDQRRRVISHRKYGKIRTKSGFWGSGGVWGDFSYKFVTYSTRAAQKLRRIILLHLGQFHFVKIWKPIMFMIFGFGDGPMTPQSNSFQLRRQKRLRTVR